MAVVAPEHWFLPPEQSLRRPHFTTGNAVVALIDGMSYMADLQRTLSVCDDTLAIAAWRASGEQLLNPSFTAGVLGGETFVDAVTAAARRGASVKALLFNVPGTQAPGPFRIWHAKDNFEFAKAVRRAGGEAVLDSRHAHIPASSHHQKFIVVTSKSARSVAYVGGVDIALDRWDRPAHDAAAERQRDHIAVGSLEPRSTGQAAWHDVQLRIEGPAVAQVWKGFRDRWNDARRANYDPLLADYCIATRLDGDGPVCSPAGTQAVQVNMTMPSGIFPEKGGPGDATVALAHAQAIAKAEHYIYFEDQYVWPCALVEPLEAALARGVHVQMVVARDYDAPGLSAIARRLRHQVVERLKKAGGERFQIAHVQRPDGKQIYVHAKVLIVDDCYASVGSANFNARSLLNDTEMQIAVVDQAHVDVDFGGRKTTVCRFAHELRCALWAEHLETTPDAVRDPIATIQNRWASLPEKGTTRAIAHEVKIGVLDVDPLSEYVTTLVVDKIADVPLITVPAGVADRSTVKLLVDSVLRGPHSAILMKFLEELLNPDLAPSFAAIKSAPRDLAAAAERKVEQALDAIQDIARPEARAAVEAVAAGQLKAGAEAATSAVTGTAAAIAKPTAPSLASRLVPALITVGVIGAVGYWGFVRGLSDLARFIEFLRRLWS